MLLYNYYSMEFESKRWIIAQATRLSLSGHSQEDIARQLKVSEGTVNSIIQDISKSDDTFLLQHEIAIICRKEGIPIRQLASNLQYVNAIKRKGFEKNKIESLLQAVNSIFTEDASISPQLAAKLVHQICNMILKYNVAPNKLAEQLESKYRELDDINEKIKENKNQLAESEYEKNVTLEKNNSTLEQVEQFANTKEELEGLGIDIRNLVHIVNIFTNVRELGWRPRRIITQMKKYNSIRNKKALLEQECDVLESNLEAYRKKHEEERKYFNWFYASKIAFDKLLSMGVKPDHIYRIHEIVSRHSPALSLDELVNDIDTYGAVKSAIFKNGRMLTKLNMTSQMNVQIY